MNPKKHYEQRVHWKGGKAPEAPDYAAQAREQGDANLEAQREAIAANRVDQHNPWGSSTWSQAPGVMGEDGKMGQGAWTQNTTLNAADQAKLDSQRGIESGMMNTATGMMGRVSDGYSTPFNYDGAPAAGNFNLDGAPEAGRAGFEVNEEYRNAIMSRMAPDLLRQRERQEAQLVAQGVGGNTNSASWDRAQQDLGRNETDASMQALMKGYDVANTEFDKSNELRGNWINEQGLKFNNDNTARGNWVNEQALMRDRPMDEMLNVLRGTRSVSDPNFGSFAQQGAADPADLNGAAGAQYGAAMDKYNAGQAQRSSNISTGVAAAGTVAVVI